METSSASREKSCARLERSGTHRVLLPPGSARSADPFPGQQLGETEAHSWSETTPGSDRGNISNVFQAEPLPPLHPSRSTSFLPTVGALASSPPGLRSLPWLCGAWWGTHGCVAGRFGCWRTSASLPGPRGPSTTSGPRPWPLLRRLRLSERFSSPADKQAPGCKCHHRNRCYLKQTRALLTLKVTRFLHD